MYLLFSTNFVNMLIEYGHFFITKKLGLKKMRKKKRFWGSVGHYFVNTRQPMKFHTRYIIQTQLMNRKNTIATVAVKISNINCPSNRAWQNQIIALSGKSTFSPTGYNHNAKRQAAPRVQSRETRLLKGSWVLDWVFWLERYY
jgi:hypothetical protein